MTLEAVSLVSVRMLLWQFASGIGLFAASIAVPMSLAQWVPLWAAVLICAIGAAIASLRLADASIDTRDLWRQRRARPLLALLDDALPAGWEGPFQVSSDAPVCTYRVDVDDDRTPPFAETVLLNTAAGEPPVLIAEVRSVEGVSPPPPVRCQLILRRLVDGDWTEFIPRKGRAPWDAAGSWWACYPRRPRQPLVLRDATVPLRGEERRGFDRPAFEIPDPVTFPREPFAAELGRHEALVREHLDGLAFDAREPDPEPLGPFDGVHCLVGLISVRGNEVREVRSVGRRTAAERYERLFGIRHVLQVLPGIEVLDVIVRTDELVSLHRTRLVTTPLGPTTVRRTFVPDPEPLVFEPTRQEHARDGGRTRLFWQAVAGGEVHEAVTNAPEPARSNAELVDRLLALRYERVQRAIWESARHQDLSDGYIWFANNRLIGEGIVPVPFIDGAMLGILQQYPALCRALQDQRPYRDWYPVVIDGVRYAGLRWVPLRAGVEESTRPPNVDEVSASGHLRVVEG